MTFKKKLWICRLPTDFFQMAAILQFLAQIFACSVNFMDILGGYAPPNVNSKYPGLNRVKLVSD